MNRTEVVFSREKRFILYDKILERKNTKIILTSLATSSGLLYVPLRFSIDEHD